MRRAISQFSKVAATTLLCSLAFATNALAYTTDAGEEAGPGWSVFETVLWFVGAPLGIMATIWLLWSIPKWRRSSAPTTGENWNPQPSSDVAPR